MIGCSVVAILTTVGIIASLLYEAWAFFQLVPPHEFFFGLRWEPQIAIRADQVAGAGAFGAVPVFLGTLVISVIAMPIAVPTGIFTAIYLIEYASDRVRAVVKPMLEILAGVPTVVYGFFAVLTVAPAIRQAGQPDRSRHLAELGARRRPRHGHHDHPLRLLAVGRRAEGGAAQPARRLARHGRDPRRDDDAASCCRRRFPASWAACCSPSRRAIGETMIVVMAAGLIASMTINPLDSVTTVTVQIVTLLIGDTEFDSPKTLAAFALGLVLFAITLILNVIALGIVRRYREQYE